jgi:outer membrane protein TolC
MNRSLPRLTRLCGVLAAACIAWPAGARCLDDEIIVEARIGSGKEAVPTTAQGPRMDIHGLVKEAIRRSHAIGAAKLLAEAAADDAEEQRVARYPRVDVGGTVGRSGSMVEGYPDQVGNQARGGLTVTMPLYDGGRISRLTEWRSQLAEAARLGELTAEEQIGLQTVSLVLERGRYRVQGQVYQQYARKMSCLVQALETIVSADKGRASELVQARKTEQQAELARVQTDSAIKQVEVRLRRFVGDALPTDDAIPNGLLALPDLRELLEEAERSSEIAAMTAQAEASDRYAHAVVAGQRPQVSASVTGSKVKGIDNQSSYFAGLSINIPLYNAGNDYSASAARKRADAARLQRADALEARKFRMAEVHEQAAAAFDRARRTVGIVRDSDKVRNYTLQQWQQLGKRSLFDVMSSESEHYNMRIAYVNSLYDGQQATAMMWSLGLGVLSRLQ